MKDNFRVWFFDHAQHGVDPRSKREGTHVVSYAGALQQALRDVSLWAEKGVVPASNTEYKVVDGLVRVLPKAAKRKGIQPVVDLSANRRVRAEVAVGERVNFTAKIEVPPGTCGVVGADWDFAGTGNYAVPGTLSDPGTESVNVTATHTFSKPSTYFPALRATYGRVQNLGRVRVVAK